jgi:site-specific DNA-methyltransferase (adenine-specific)
MLTITNENNMNLMARYPDKHFDLAIIDPPYGIGEDGGKNHSRGKLKKPTKYASKDWDKQPPSLGYFKELKRVSKNQIIWGANHFIEKIPNSNSSCWIVWDKVNGETDFADCELAYTSFKSAVRIVKFMWNGMMQGANFKGDMQGNKKLNEIRIHPTQKPVALYKWILDKYANPNDKILDTHLGSMSIAIACADYGFDLVGCELDVDYYNKGMERINNHISQQKLF